MDLRPARPDELPLLPAVERASGEPFRDFGMPEIADDDPMPLDVLERLHVWLDTAATEEAAHRELHALAARAGLPALEGRVITPSLEDVFIAKLADLAAAPPVGTVS